MKLGRMTLTRRDVELFEAARLKQAWYTTRSPKDGDLALVALAISTTGHGIAGRPEGQSFEEYGASLRSAWLLSGASPAEIQILANTAAQALPDGSVSMARLEEARSFFGLPALSPEPASDSGTAAGMSSEGSP
jgi:hypothetical protein